MAPATPYRRRGGPDSNVTASGTFGSPEPRARPYCQTPQEHMPRHDNPTRRQHSLLHRYRYRCLLAVLAAAIAVVATWMLTASEVTHSTEQADVEGSQHGGGGDDVSGGPDATRWSVRVGGGGQELFEAVRALRVEDEHSNGYVREEWHDGWDTTPGEQCNMRHTLLLEAAVEVTDQHGCHLTGTWVSQWDLRHVHDSRQLHIDHVVPLAEAHRSGGHLWDRATKNEFAHYGNNLVVTSSESNGSKSDLEPGQWLPAPEATCTFVTIWVETKLVWNLSVDYGELQALERLAQNC